MSQFKDLFVLELASVLAGPAVGQFFAELGATVIKVENLRTSGDVTRAWKSPEENTDDRSAYFCSVNWGKRSIALDLTTPGGRSIVQQLAGKSHIVIASYKPGDAEKLGVDYARLSSANPGLIYGQITGYGSHNQRVGFDAIIQAEAGFMSMNGEPGGRSLKIPVALMDVLAAHHLKEGLLLALLEKGVTGEGKLVEVSLLDAAIASLANQATNYLMTGKSPGKQGSAHPNIAPYGDVFITADRKEILLAVGTDKQFGELIKLLKIKDFGASDFTSNVSRVRQRAKLNSILQEAIGAWSAPGLLDGLHQAHIPAGQIRTVAEALNDPEIQSLALTGDGLRGIRNFAARGNAISPHLSPPPHLGQHTGWILAELLKMSPSEVDGLLSAKAIK